MLGVSIPVVPVRGTMWSTKPLEGRKLNSMIFSGESSYFWNVNNDRLIKKGSYPSVTHESEQGQRLTHHLYMKQTHDGCIIAGGDRIVANCNLIPNEPIN